MPPAGFEPTTPVFERAKKFHALDGVANVIGVDIIGKDFGNKGP
jgi:hypothetical protein